MCVPSGAMRKRVPSVTLERSAFPLSPLSPGSADNFDPRSNPARCAFAIWAEPDVMTWSAGSIQRQVGIHRSPMQLRPSRQHHTQRRKHALNAIKRELASGNFHMHHETLSVRIVGSGQASHAFSSMNLAVVQDTGLLRNNVVRFVVQTDGLACWL